MITYQIDPQNRDGTQSSAPKRQSKIPQKFGSGISRIFALLGGDMRMLSLANMLTGAGHTVRLFMGPDSSRPEWAAASLEDAVKGSDAVILPIPAASGGDNLNAPAHSRKLLLTETLLPAVATLAPGAEILCGMPSDLFRAAAESAGIPLYDYGVDEAFVQENAVLTAEGLIPLLERHLGAPLDESVGPAVVAGYGRVGKAVADHLAARGISVTILCRSPRAMQEAGDKGYALLSFEKLYEKNGSHPLAGAALLLNTVPTPVFDAVTLRSFRGLYVELASAPGGRSDDAAAQMPPAAFLALPGIPGKALPEKAGVAMGRAVLRRLAHLRRKEVSKQC